MATRTAKASRDPSKASGPPAAKVDAAGEPFTYPPPGRFEADEIREGDPYELSEGRLIQCFPTGGRGADASTTGAAVLKSDPDVDAAGFDTGYSPNPDTLRAPDLAVGNVPVEPGWVKGAPALAVEYADTGQNEADLAVKIRELLEAGTRILWVVRLTGERRVEIHEPDREMRLAYPGEELEAPGILRNPVRVEALYDWQIGQETTLRNLLQREGYGSLEDVRAEGRAEARAEGHAKGQAASILGFLRARSLEVTEEQRSRIEATTDPTELERWVRRAAVVESPDQLFTED
ncbi:MAG: Uma2 family endonuclease [Acidobacteriota bacterium]